MLNFSPEKILVIAILALVVLGPNRLPAAARNAGRVVAQLRRMSGSFQAEVRDALAEPRQALQHAVDEFGIDEFRSTVTSAKDSFGTKDGFGIKESFGLGDGFGLKQSLGLDGTGGAGGAAPAPVPTVADRAAATSRSQTTGSQTTGSQTPVPDDPSLN